jgi:hypothetical protein
VKDRLRLRVNPHVPFDVYRFNTLVNSIMHSHNATQQAGFLKPKFDEPFRKLEEQAV